MTDDIELDDWEVKWSQKGGVIQFGDNSTDFFNVYEEWFAEHVVTLHNAEIDRKNAPMPTFWYTRNDDEESLIKIFPNPPHSKPFCTQNKTHTRTEWYSKHEHGVWDGIPLTVEQFEQLWPGLYMPGPGEGPYPVRNHPLVAVPVETEDA